METAKEVLEHMRFQLDLLKITAMPVELTGPSIMHKSENQNEAVRVMEELTSQLNKTQLNTTQLNTTQLNTTQQT